MASKSMGSSLHTGVTFIPFDIIEEILLRVEAYSILRCKCVCKSWHSLIRDQAFARRHLNRQRTSTLFLSDDVLSARRRSKIFDRDVASPNYHLPKETKDSQLAVEGYDNGIKGEQPTSYRVGFGLDPISKVFKVVKLCAMSGYGEDKHSNINIANYDIEKSLSDPADCSLSFGDNGDVLFCNFDYSGVAWYDPKNNSGNKLELLFGDEFFDHVVPNFAESFLRIK
ncbi:F-box domain containing protein [Trema orientale]|uniref:F-box domain containing protein n=1 Tax=Trema orientale TaxID=63057 RepID=A0A2P5BLQ1_TREOI|nr:F-box domain containing protein [Trema orientale]